MMKHIWNIPAKICLVSAAIFLISFMLGCYTEPEVEREYTVITAVDLWEEFQADKEAASTKYLEQWCEITGVVQYVGRDPGNMGRKPFVMLTDLPPDKKDRARVGFRLEMEEHLLATYKKGDIVTFRGKVIGTYSEDIVFLSQGIIVE